MSPPLKDRLYALSIPEPNTGCWLWTGVRCTQGYGKISLVRRGKRKLRAAHRASYECFNGKIPDGIWVLHRCDTPACINPEHLFLGTAKDNTADMIKKGRNRPPYGNHNARSKLSIEIAQQIRRAYASGGTSYFKLSQLYGVTPTAIQQVVRNLTWKSLP